MGTAGVEGAFAPPRGPVRRTIGNAVSPQAARASLIAAVVLFSACSPCEGRPRLHSAAAPSAAAPTPLAIGRPLRPPPRRRRPPAERRPPRSASTTAPSSRCGPGPRREARAQPLVDAYNASHKNQVELTVIPTDDYQAKVGAAAGANGLPDLFAADVVFMPNWTSQGLFQDVTDRIDGAAVRGQDRAGRTSTRRPGTASTTASRSRRPVRLAVQQGALHEGRARPGEAADDAEGVRRRRARRRQARRRRPRHVLRRQLRRLRGLHLVADRWADGEQVMDADGTSRSSTATRTRQIYATFRALVDDGTVWMPASKNETGPTWIGSFQSGKIGIMPMAGDPAPASPSENLKLERCRRHPDRRPQRRPVDLRRRRRASASAATARSPTRPGTSSPGSRTRRPRSTSSPRAATCVVAHRPRHQPVHRGRPAPRDVQHDRGQGPDPVRHELRRRPSTTRRARGSPCSATRSSATPSKIDADNDAINESLQPVAERGAVRALPRGPRPRAPSVDDARNRGGQRLRRHASAARPRADGCAAGGARRRCSASLYALPTRRHRRPCSSSCRCSWSAGCRLSNWPLLRRRPAA